MANKNKAGWNDRTVLAVLIVKVTMQVVHGMNDLKLGPGSFNRLDFFDYFDRVNLPLICSYESFYALG